MVANFPDEFEQPESNRIDLIKKLGLVTVKKSNLSLDYKQRAELDFELRKIKKEIYEQTKIKESFVFKFKKEDDNWEKTLFRIHRQTGTSLKELKSMSVYDFYSYKKNTIEEIKK